MELTDLLIDLKKDNEKYFLNPVSFAGRIKKRAVELFGDQVKTFLFGSVVKGNFTPLSDIDVLVVAPGLKPGIHPEKIVFLKQDIERWAPFSIILCNEKQFEDWYQPYILDKFIEV